MSEEQRQFLKLCASGFFLYFSYALSRSPIIPLYAQSFGASPEIIGWAVAASTITGIVMKLPAGTFSDILGRKILLLLGGCVFAITPFFYPLAATVGGLIVLRFVHGNATAVFGPTASAAISDICAPTKRGVRLGLYASVQGVGQALGPLLSGFLISWKGFGLPFLVSGFVGMVGLLFLLFSPKESENHGRKQVISNFVESFRAIASNRGIIVTSAAVSSQMFVVGAYNAFLPIYAKEVVGLDAWHIGIIFGVQTTTTLLTRPLMGTFSDRVGRKPLILAALLWCAVLISLLSSLTYFTPLVAFGFAWGLGTSVVSSVASALITDLAKRDHYGTAHGTYGTIFDIGEATGPIVAGILLTHIGFTWMFVAIALQLLIMSIVFATTKLQGVIA